MSNCIYYIARRESKRLENILDELDFADDFNITIGENDLKQTHDMIDSANMEELNLNTKELQSKVININHSGSGKYEVIIFNTKNIFNIDDTRRIESSNNFFNYENTLINSKHISNRLSITREDEVHDFKLQINSSNDLKTDINDASSKDGLDNTMQFNDQYSNANNNNIDISTNSFKKNLNNIDNNTNNYNDDNDDIKLERRDTMTFWKEKLLMKKKKNDPNKSIDPPISNKDVK